MANPAQIYQQVQVKTANPGELTLMLYNGGIRFSKEAILFIEKKEMDKAHASILRVQEIINELDASLDRSITLSEQFILMYDYMRRRTIEANIKKDSEIIKEVEGYFVEFRDTWKEVMRLSKHQPEGQ
ncbi:flagellar export chaperone FliS [Brevibacillus daliensis]|uniref:flagellar export chaperone FliS n=1 Tax=Brevibacillus daliensis TaxID=2892995 RepID=UPI001E59FFC1|nr:flagellar export chaperone FliS [Brevibacillus daliensis]